MSEDILKRLQACAIAGCSPPERALALEAATEIARLRYYAVADARCPCCEQTDKCLEDCTFAADWPAGAQRTAAARAALGVAVKEVG